MTANPRVILLEFNELTPGLIDRFCNEGLLPNFTKFRRESIEAITEAEERAPQLEPWIQWVTVHTGLNQRDHGISQLDEGHQLPVRRIWDLVAERNLPVWVCGSMNANYQAGLRGAVLPDPWCTKVDPTPRELDTYFRFVQKNVLEYTNERLPLRAKDYAAFLKFLVTNGLSASTVAAVLSQLAAERRSNRRWQRAAILDKLQFDVFRAFYGRIRPVFSTFFLNSTAHFQHAYWRHMEPERFTVQPSPEEHEVYGDAIRYGYQQMDGLLGRFLKIAGADVTLIFATALSQQPYLKFEEQGGASFYRPRDFTQFASVVGLPANHTIAPVMAHQFHIELNDESAARAAEMNLKRLRVGGKRLLQAERSGHRILCACDLYAHMPENATIEFEGSSAAIPFFDLFYTIDAVKSGMHHPDGMLWIRTPRRHHAVVGEKVALDRVAPTILGILGIAPPAYMKSAPLHLPVLEAAVA